MVVPAFDERVDQVHLPMEVFKWFCDATRYATDEPDSASEVSEGLWTVLRSLAAHPKGQSEAIRTAMGTLVDALMAQPKREKTVLDFSALLIRIIDSKKQVRVDPMKHVAISGLGHLARHIRLDMRQMATNFFVVLLEVLRISPSSPQDIEQERFRCTALWALTQSATPSLDTGNALAAYRLVKGWVHIPETWGLLCALVATDKLPKKADSLHALFLKGLESTDNEVQYAAAKFYAAVNIDFRKAVEDAAALYVHWVGRKPRQARGIVLYLEILLQSKFRSQQKSRSSLHLEPWLAQALVSLGGGNVGTREPPARRLLVDTVMHQLGSEQTRLDAAKTLLRLLATREAPPKPVIACLAGAVAVLGDAVAPIADPIHQACLSLLESADTDYWVDVVDLCRVLVDIVPALLLPTIDAGLRRLETGPSWPHTYLVATMVGFSTLEPMYGAVDISCRIMLEGAGLVSGTAGGLVSPAPSLVTGASPGSSGPTPDAYSTGWTLVAGAMALGPRVVRSATSQLLRLWETHLPRLDDPELLERALTGLAAFMAHNRVILTADVAQRIGTVLHSVSESHSDITVAPTLVARRLLQCYDLLSSVERSDIYPASLLTRCVVLVSNPDIPDQASKTKSGWEASYEDPQGCGLCGLAVGIAGNLANDVDQLLIGVDVAPVPASTAVLDLVISVVAKVLPLQPPKVQESLLDTLRTNVEIAQRRRKGIRRFAVVANTAQIVWHALNYAHRHHLDSYRDPRLTPVLVDIVRELLRSLDPHTRRLSARTFGLLAVHLGRDATGVLIKNLVDDLVRNLEPASRSALALSLGYIVERAPRSHTAPLLNLVASVLGRLAHDPDPQVHTCVLEALRLTLGNSEPLESSYTRQTLRIASECYILETHSGPGVKHEVARILGMVVSTLGPGLAERKTTLAGVLRLVDQFRRSTDPHLKILAWHCLQELYYYVRPSVSWAPVVREWCVWLASDDRDLRRASATCLRILFELSAASMLALASPKDHLPTRLWLALDREPLNSQLRELLDAWLRQTGTLEPDRWVQRLLQVVMRPRTYFSRDTGPDDGPSEAANERGESNLEVPDEDQTLDVRSDASTELLGWETRLVGVDMLQMLVQMVDSSQLVRTVGDIVKVAFSAATSPELAMQVAGLGLLNELIHQFGSVADPDFPDISVLEQYQVQITSALIPAFSSDATPSLALAALDTVATFVGSPVVRTPDKLTRILRLLEQALESLSEGEFRLGQVPLTPNAAQILRLGCLRVWALLAVASREAKPALRTVLEPWESQLGSLWYTALRQYALLLFEPEDESTTTMSLADAVGPMEAALLRQVVLPTYRGCWVDLVSALALALANNNDEDSGTPEVEADSTVLFGLCMEGLVRHYRQDQERILSALARVVAHGGTQLVYGNPAIFGEVVATLRRAAITGSVSQQELVVRVSRELVLSQLETDATVDTQFDLLRLAILPLRSLFPDAFDIVTDSPQLRPDQISLATYTMDAVLDIVEVFRDIIQTDLRVCLLRLFDRIVVGTERPGNVQAALSPSFERLLRSLPEHSTGVQNALDAVLGRALSSDKESALHTCMLVVCSVPRASQEKVRAFGQRAAHFLCSDNHTERLAAAQCIRTVVLATAGRSIGTWFALETLPILTTVAAADSVTDSQIPRLACDALMAYSIKVPEALSVTIPALVAVSQNEAWLDSEQRQAYVRRILLGILMRHSGEFKKGVQGLVSQDRTYLQVMLVQPSNESHANDEDSDAEITLTSFA